MLVASNRLQALAGNNQVLFQHYRDELGVPLGCGDDVLQREQQSLVLFGGIALGEIRLDSRHQANQNAVTAKVPDPSLEALLTNQHVKRLRCVI